MGRHAGLLLGVGLTAIVTAVGAQVAVIAGFWVEWQRSARRSCRSRS